MRGPAQPHDLQCTFVNQGTRRHTRHYSAHGAPSETRPFSLIAAFCRGLRSGQHRGVQSMTRAETSFLVDEEPPQPLSAESAIVVEHVGLELPDAQPMIIEDITLRIADGELISIIGPSGGGKTTFLNILAGLQRYTAGSVLVRGHRPSAGRPDSAYVMARDALLPWRTALQNVELSLQIRGIANDERRDRALSALDSVGLRDAADRYRAQLSQGMRQRVSLARAFVGQPSLILLDEPFAALDAQTRIVMGDLLLDLLKAFSGTAVLVTHDLNEAIMFADRIVVFSQRPTRVMATHDVNIPRPRNSLQVRKDRTFVELYEQLWHAIAGTVPL